MSVSVSLLLLFLSVLLEFVSVSLLYLTCLIIINLFMVGQIDKRLASLAARTVSIYCLRFIVFCLLLGDK